MCIIVSTTAQLKATNIEHCFLVQGQLAFPSRIASTWKWVVNQVRNFGNTCCHYKKNTDVILWWITVWLTGLAIGQCLTSRSSQQVLQSVNLITNRDDWEFSYLEKHNGKLLWSHHQQPNGKMSWDSARPVEPELYWLVWHAIWWNMCAFEFCRRWTEPKSNRSGVHRFEWHWTHSFIECRRRERCGRERGDIISRCNRESTAADVEWHRTTWATSTFQHPSDPEPESSRKDHGRQRDEPDVGHDQQAGRVFLDPSGGHYYSRQLHRSEQRWSTRYSSVALHNVFTKPRSSCEDYNSPKPHRLTAAIRQPNHRCGDRNTRQLSLHSCTRRSFLAKDPGTLFPWRVNTSHRECERQSFSQIQLLPKTGRSGRLHCRNTHHHGRHELTKLFETSLQQWNCSKFAASFANRSQPDLSSSLPQQLFCRYRFHPSVVPGHRSHHVALPWRCCDGQSRGLRLSRDGCRRSARHRRLYFQFLSWH